MMEQITPGVSIDYLKKMGITTLNEKDENLALALGGLDKGISPLEMAGAYSTIANDGVYIEPTFYTKITSSKGKDILKSKQESRRVFSESVAYVTKKLLTQPVVGANGTATYCAITGMEVAAKTGTTNEDYDRWLCGFTNYYTAVTWFGYDLSEPIRYNGRNPAGIIWSNVMNQIHTKLKNSDFKEVKGVISQKICKKSLKVANSGCADTYTEYFVKGTVPGTCTVHKGTVLNIEVDEDAKQKIKDTVKSTINGVKNEINSQPEEAPAPTSQETPSVPDTTLIQEQTPTAPEENNSTQNEDISEDNIVENENQETNSVNENDNQTSEMQNTR